MAAKRDVSPVVQLLRDFLLKRKNVNFLRFEDEVSARTQPQPNLPEGPNHKLAANYYYNRDARRLVTPTQVVFQSDSVPKLEDKTKQAPPVSERVPGQVYLWDQ